jgi:gas vesicle protein
MSIDRKGADMKRLLLWMLGLFFGALLGALLVALFAPVTGVEFRRRLKDGYRETLDEAQRVSQQRQSELEAQLARMQGKT